MFFLIKGVINVYQYKSDTELEKEKERESKQIYTTSNPRIKSTEEILKDSFGHTRDSP